jgi:hypothetical protein
MHLTLNGCVAIRFNILTYCVYAPLLNRVITRSEDADDFIRNIFDFSVADIYRV